ncbi:MAG: hypothetical protein COX81_00035 [Candidatus Magasanikbacteria bacterium CG_4_10_14_0_2_um_filter_37_12]|uniref:Glycosyltransferase family 1 protein n=1 Tax=Candidatus Magasanikbacteria bacterium CG_4_10_14_0_2_um_filter_37_12 TaxID=1974637 RepID=A0A2M7VAE4_9BACT|nr:MAG: hypothetical protein COX81_00035 [Candidatus Magasanikbacteria bacterium CG_4_10_14_0_2_um_filter_37_12]
MNIAIDIRSLTEKKRTGVGEYTYQFLDTTFSSDHTNQYFLFYNSFQDVSDHIPKWEQENVHYVISHWPSKLFNLFVWMGVIKLDRFIEKKLEALDFRLQITSIHSFLSPNINFISLNPKTKFILTIHDLSFEYFKDCYSLKRRLWHKFVNPRKLCQRADEIIVPSENTKRDVIREYKIDAGKVSIEHPRLSFTFYEQRTTNDEQVKLKYNLPDKYILFLGTIEPRKNILSLIEAFKNSELGTMSYELIIAGAKGWKYKDILEAIEKTPSVRYLGYVDKDDKIDLYKMASLFVYPSFYEGFGLPVLEAMYCGTSVIASNRSSLMEVADGGAYLVNPHNVDEIARAIVSLA